MFQTRWHSVGTFRVVNHPTRMADVWIVSVCAAMHVRIPAGWGLARWFPSGRARHRSSSVVPLSECVWIGVLVEESVGVF